MVLALWLPELMPELASLELESVELVDVLDVAVLLVLVVPDVVVPDVVVPDVVVPDVVVPVVVAAESVACPTPATSVMVSATAPAVRAAPAAVARRNSRRAGWLVLALFGVPVIPKTLAAGASAARQIDIKPGSRRGRHRLSQTVQFLNRGATVTLSVGYGSMTVSMSVSSSG
jgi:hypothetical protein